MGNLSSFFAVQCRSQRAPRSPVTAKKARMAPPRTRSPCHIAVVAAPLVAELEVEIAHIRITSIKINITAPPCEKVDNKLCIPHRDDDHTVDLT